MAKVLKLTFTCADSKEWTLSLRYPKDNLTLAQANTCMDAIITQGIFLTAPVTKKSAEIVETTTTVLS
ncbi:MAG TPA: DUF2922 domain-containing protein [Synergistaceae bacterium]|nr:DUF2922 domain-containing protein [Synergistaceae bacterium]